MLLWQGPNAVGRSAPSEPLIAPAGGTPSPGHLRRSGTRQSASRRVHSRPVSDATHVAEITQDCWNSLRLAVPTAVAPDHEACANSVSGVSPPHPVERIPSSQSGCYLVVVSVRPQPTRSRFMATPSAEQTHEAPFRPRARVLQLLGDELIGSPRLAVFELVKNAYDADATAVAVRIDLSSGAEPMITVTDDGDGMSLELLRSVWLVPGDDHRRRQREQGRRSARHHRLPLGEKGLGRFAVHKLGNRIEVTTRAAGSHECVVDIDWNNLIEKPFLDEAPVTVRERPAKLFVGGRTGTRIRIWELRGPDWKRGEVRRLANQITSICSPFEEPGGFRATLEVPGNQDWIAALPDFVEILRRATWEFSFRLAEDGRFDSTTNSAGCPDSTSKAGR